MTKIFKEVFINNKGFEYVIETDNKKILEEWKRKINKKEIKDANRRNL